MDCADTLFELAKLYEHYLRDPARALAILKRGTLESPPRANKRSERLARKVAKKSQAALDLPGATKRG